MDEHVSVQTVDSPPTVSAPAPAEAPATPTFTERQKAWTPAERQHWEATAEEPTVSAEPAKGKSEPEAAPGTEKQEPALTVEERSKRDSEKGSKRMAKFYQQRINEEVAARKATEQRIAELEKANRPEPAPGALKTPAKADGRPVRPKLSDFQTVEEYESAVDVYEDKRDAYTVQQAEARRLASERQRFEEETHTRQEQRHAELHGSWLSKEEAFVQGNDALKNEYIAAKEQLMGFLDGLPRTNELRRLWGAIISTESPEVMFHIAKDENVLERIINRDSFEDVLAEFGAVKAEVLASLKKAPKPNKLTQAGDPPEQLGGKQEHVSGPKVGSVEWQRQLEAEMMREAGVS